jgi:hypothetical protein
MKEGAAAQVMENHSVAALFCYFRGHWVKS